MKNQKEVQKLIRMISGSQLGDYVYMIPTKHNLLKNITKYEILSYSLSDIGARVLLKALSPVKVKFYTASVDMFGNSIFFSEENAYNKMHNIIES